MENNLDKHFFILKICKDEAVCGQIECPISIFESTFFMIQESFPKNKNYYIQAFNYQNQLVLDSRIVADIFNFNQRLRFESISPNQ